MRRTFYLLAAAFASIGATAQDYELRVLTFEDEDYKGTGNIVGSNDWSSIIPAQQYGDPLTYGESGMGAEDASEAYQWYDEGNTELGHMMVEVYGSYAYWNGGHVVSHYGCGDVGSTNSYMHQLTVYKQDDSGAILTSGCGHNGSNNFAVHFGYSDDSGYGMDGRPLIMFYDGEERVVDHMYVNITNYLYSCVYDGNGLTDKLNKGERVWISATGYDSNEEETGKVFFDIAKSTEDGAEIISEWTKWDLSTLGKVLYIKFNMGGKSDNGYGFSQPAYFAYDDVAVRFEKVEEFEPSTFEEIIIAEGTNTWHGDTEIGFNYWQSGSNTFNSYKEDYGEYGVFYYGFTVSNDTDNTFATYADDTKSANGGAFEGENYAVWYYNYNGGNEISLNVPTQLTGFAVNNTAWVVDAIINGDNMSNDGGLPFGQDDYLKLSIAGFDKDGNATGTVDYYLADFRSEEDWTYVSNWQWVDLTSLGEVAKISFSMTGSKHNDMGLTTPTYFCIDNLGSVAPESTEDLTHVTPTVAPTGMDEAMDHNQSIVAIYNMNGQKLNQLEHGLNIVEYSNGKTRKVVLK